MAEFAKHGVYTEVPIAQCWHETGNGPIGTHWVDVNKGDEVTPEYRRRVVAQELNQGKREDLFAATPPLEALKMLSLMESVLNGRRDGPELINFPLAMTIIYNVILKQIFYMNKFNFLCWKRGQERPFYL